MSSILIKSDSKESDILLFQLAKVMKMPITVVNEHEEDDLFFIKAMDEGMQSGEAQEKELKKFFKKYGIKIH